MAEYAGLEIRIGGDTTKLTNALKASTKSAADLQSRIRQATKAMQFDPTDLSNIDTRIKLTGNRMESLSSKVQIVRTAMEQLGSAMTHLKDADGNFKSVKQVASETDNLSLAAKQADERFNGLTDTLAKIYESWNNFSRAQGADYLSDKLDIPRDEAEQLMKASTSASTLVTELKRIRDMRKDPIFGDGKDVFSDADIQKAKELKNLNFHNMFKNGTDLDEMIEKADRLGVVIEESAVENVRGLQTAFKDAQREKKTFDDTLKYEQMGVDIQRYESEIVSMSNDIRRLDDGMTEIGKSEPFQNLESRLREVDAALDNVNNDLERTESAMKLDPSNIDLATRRLGDLQQQANLSEEKASILRQELDMLEADGVKEAAEGHRDLAKWVEESAESARKANIEYNNQKATVSNLDNDVKSLSQRIENMKGSSTITEASQNVIEWKKQTQNLTKAMEDLKVAEQKVSDNQQKLGEIQGNFDKATKDVDEYKSKLDSLEQEYRQLDEAYRKIYNDPNVDFDTKLGMYNRLQELPAEIKRVETSYKGAQEEVKIFNNELELQAERVKISQSALEQQKTKVADLKNTVKELEKTSEVKFFKNPTGEIEKAEGELRELQGELDEAKDKFNQVENAYSAAKSENELAKTANKTRELSAELADTEIQAKATNDAIKGLDMGGILNASTVKSISMTMSATLTPTIAAVGYKMVDASATVDAAYRDMRKTVEGTEEQFEALKKSAIDFSRTHVTSADQILQIEAIGGELGIATEDLETFAEVISNIDVATNLDTESAADALGHLANIMKLSKDDYVGFSDALVRLGNNGASTETEIANIAERIGSMASIVNMSAPDVLAWSSSIASTGQNAEAAGTAISKTMSFFETAVAAAGGTIDTSFESISAAVQNGGSELVVFSNLMGQTAEEFAQAWESDPEAVFNEVTATVDNAKNSLQGIADVAHMTASEFAKTWESDPTAAMEAFIKGLNDIEASGGSADAVLQNFGITSVRQKQAIEGLMQTIGGLDNNLTMSRDAWKGVSDEWGQAGDAANEAAKKAEGFSGQIQILKNMAQIALSELGEGAVPYIKLLSGALEGLSSWFSSVGSGVKTFIVGFGGLAAAAGPLLSMTGTFLTAKQEVKDWLDTTVNATALVKSAFASGGDEAVKALTGTMSAMDKFKLIAKDLGTSLLGSLKVVAIVAALAAIGFAVKKLYDDWKTHVKATSGLTSAMKGIGDAAEASVDGVNAASISLSELVNNSKGYEKRLAGLADTIDESNKQYGQFAGNMNYYSDTISTLGSKSELTQSEAYKLEAALKAVNDACGTTYGLDEYNNIIDTTTGKIMENTDVINANIEARKQQALIEYYSDDYTEAVGQLAEAQENLNTATENYNTLASDQGKHDYLEQAKRTQGAFYDEEKALAAYDYELGLAKDAISNYQQEVNRTQAVVDTLEGKISSATDEMDRANQVIDDAAKAQEAFDRRSAIVAGDVTGNMKRMSDTMDKMGGTDSGFNSIVDGLEAVHVSAEEMNDVDMGNLITSFTDAGSSMSDVIATLENGGVQMTTWNEALEAAPGAAENMGSVTASAFQSMYEIAGENIDGTMSLIAGLDEVQVGDKTFYIGDNGSIVDEQGQIYNIKTDLDTIPTEVITAYYVNDNDAQQKALETKEKLSEIGNENPTPTISVRDNAIGPTNALRDRLNEVGGMTPSPSAYLNDYASDGITYISSRLRGLDGSSATVTIYENTKKTSQATGGMNNVPVIPRHATGYIATGPTLTNQGWIGEDGIEAVANWATGGAVVPLTNKRYMLPIADAIADGMASRVTQAGGDTYSITVYANGDSGDEIAQAVVGAIRSQNLRSGHATVRNVRR